MLTDDIQVGRIKLEGRPLQSTLNFVSDRQVAQEN